MSIAWTPIRLAMSSSTQAPSQDGHQSSSPSHVGRINSFRYSDDNLREETVLERQTVRITPPLYTESKTLLLEKRKQNGIDDSCAQPTRIQNTWAADELDYLIRVNPPYGGVDKGCQTDEFPTTSNMDRSYGDSADTLHQKMNFRVAQSEEVDNSCRPSTDFVVARADIESRDRELEHVDVIVAESKFASEASEDIIVKASDEPKQNGSVRDAKSNSKIDSVKESANLEKDEEEESCCVNCLYITLNVCDCVIL